jgi:hypothetical protein
MISFKGIGQYWSWEEMNVQKKLLVCSNCKQKQIGLWHLYTSEGEKLICELCRRRFYPAEEGCYLDYDSYISLLRGKLRKICGFILKFDKEGRKLLEMIDQHEEFYPYNFILEGLFKDMVLYSEAMQIISQQHQST